MSSIGCDTCGRTPAIWYVVTSDPAPALVRSRYACGEHLDQAKAVVGDKGRSVTVSPLADAEDAPLAEKFEAFHEANPHVYRILVRLAREWVTRTGRRRCGIAQLFERARWELAVETTEDPNLNNSYRAYYARLIMRNEPDLAGLFEVRRSAADEWLEAA